MNLLFTHTLSTLLNVASPVKHSIEMSRAISEFGILIVLSAVMIVTFIASMIFMFRNTSQTNKKMLETQTLLEKQNEQIIGQNETIKDLLNKLSDTENLESKIEQTQYNAESIIKMSFSDNLVKLLKGTVDILIQDNTKDEEYTEERIRRLVSSEHTKRLKQLNSYKYNGITLEEYAKDENFIVRKCDIIKNFIYSDDQNLATLLRELSLANVEFNNELTL